MASNRPIYESLADMPKALQDFLVSAEYGKADIELQKIHRLTDAQISDVGDAMMDAIFGDIPLEQAVRSIKAKLIPAVMLESKWKVFLSDLLREEAWPLRDVFGEELTHVLSEEGMSTAGWPVFRVLIRPLTFSGAATEVATQAGFNFMGPQLRERMRDLIVSKIKGVRVDSQVKEVLMRPSDFGGLGLDEATAARAIAAMNNIIGKVPIMSEEEYADHLAEEARKRNEAEEEAIKAAAGPTTPEDAEIEGIKARMVGQPKAPPSVLEAAVEKIWTSLLDKPSDDYSAKRLRNVISSRLRDVRSQTELVQLLQRDTKVGGLGMTKDIAERTALKIEEGYQSFRTPIMEDEKKKIDVQMEEQKKKIDERRKREAEEHAKWYQEKVLARRTEEDSQRKLGEQFKQTYAANQAAAKAQSMPKPAAVAPTPMDAKEQKRESERFGQMVPAAAAGAAPIAQVAPSVQARPEVKVSMPTVEIQAQAAPVVPQGMGGVKPRMEDIRIGPRLVGLTQELSELTLAEFRRLAKDPEEAARKIVQKLDTLGGEAFEKRLAGIQAWQQSPLQQTYLNLVGESFRSATPVVQLAESKRAAGIDAPTPEEISAIISLNGKLHF